MPITVSASEIEELYNTLDKIGCLGDSREAGYLRAAYSDEETQAMKFIESKALLLGATARWDKVGNLALDWAGETDEFVEVGSHLDTVKDGGNFDGVAGIVSGLLAIKNIKKANPSLKRGLRLRIWRAEESGTFGIVYGGSKAAFGMSDPRSLAYSFQGRTYEEAMKSQGADPEVYRSKTRTVSQEEVDKIYAHLELHIEQANQLEIKQKDLGIVTSVRGPTRFRVVLRGEFDHSGATPMGVEFRKDANLAMAYMQVALNELLERYLERGEDLVQTFGLINTDLDFNKANPIVFTNGLTTVSGFAYFSWDIRTNSKSTMERFVAEAHQTVRKVSEKFKVTCEIIPISSSTPLEELNKEIQEIMIESANALGVSCMSLSSGAGHDVVIVAQQSKSDGSKLPVGLLFIPCRRGKSHSADEFTSAEAISKGASVLATGIFQLANAN
jgi:N-carbamoyl-L-amino-acid hydrolase